ncbi:hypothetical protein PROFUN_14177 [Planoprotostelium fungivorum]|uniref:Uncharacterized protein n=1 Tax=Planoprotostelium fungivorum TaxID=1890364 RepID=A0A2P6N0Q3_9EUKA|nr:hypothetical protein PROFUN_14177 [Planoprotostelium fungivorum]
MKDEESDKRFRTQFTDGGRLPMGDGECLSIEVTSDDGSWIWSEENKANSLRLFQSRAWKKINSKIETLDDGQVKYYSFIHPGLVDVSLKRNSGPRWRESPQQLPRLRRHLPVDTGQDEHCCLHPRIYTSTSRWTFTGLVRTYLGEENSYLYSTSKRVIWSVIIKWSSYGGLEQWGEWICLPSPRGADLKERDTVIQRSRSSSNQRHGVLSFNSSVLSCLVRLIRYHCDRTCFNRSSIRYHSLEKSRNMYSRLQRKERQQFLRYNSRRTLSIPLDFTRTVNPSTRTIDSTTRTVNFADSTTSKVNSAHTADPITRTVY